jgi:UDP-N-acetylglucosamine:LPS N-acetylglucosamine transferase
MLVPHLDHHAIARDDASRMSHQEYEHVELLGPQLDLGTPDPRAARRGVGHHITDLDGGVDLDVHLAEVNPDPSEQLRKREGLADVVHRACVEADDDVDFGLAGGDHDDRQKGILLANPSAHLDAIHIGEPKIEKDQIAMAEREQRTRAIAHPFDLISVHLERSYERRPDHVIVLDDQHSLDAHRPRLRGTPGCWGGAKFNRRCTKTAGGGSSRFLTCEERSRRGRARTEGLVSGLLIFSARMGAGHDGAANELARRARANGHEATVVDFLDAFPRPLARIWEWFYLTQLRRWPESYESSYQLFYRYPILWSPFVRFERALAGRRSLRWIRSTNPDAVVSTYSFATLVLGRLREEGLVDVPVVAYLTDFGVHPRTVHPAVDLHLTVHPQAADETRKYVPGPVASRGAAVDPAFGIDRVPREIARKELGLDDDACVVLVVSGSWGIGAGLASTVGALVGDGRFCVITLCGRDSELRGRLEAEGLGTAVGWTDDMHLYLAAADVVVENAGGLTSLEAFAAGVPVVSFDPIPGHGRDNVRSMVRAGVTTAPADLLALCTACAELSHDSVTRRLQIAAADAMFVSDPIDAILELVDHARVQ